ncbi:MAG: ABC transporter permease, partial [Terriglobales bacterium]
MATGLLQDLRYALRQLRKNHCFTAIALITLALGIGANTAIFSVVNGVLLRRLPYADADCLALIWSVSDNDKRNQLSYTDIDDYRAQSRAFEDVVAFGNWNATFTGAGDTERIHGMQVSDGYFRLMRVHPLLGRDFAPEEQTDGKDQVIILTYGLWQRRYAGDPAVIGRQISLGGRPYVVVGVMPQDFPMLPMTLVDGPAEFYRPVAEKHDDKERLSRHLRAIARFKAGVSISEAQADLNLVNRRLAKLFPAEYSTSGVRVITLQGDITAGMRPALLVLLGAIGFLLLIACVNVSNLLLARAATHQKETAIRSALGASRTRLIRQTLTESVLLALGGGVLGALIAIRGTSAIVHFGANAIPQLAGVSVDGTVLLFTAGLSILTGLVFGVVPALRTSAVSLNEALKQGARGSSSSHERFQ